MDTLSAGGAQVLLINWPEYGSWYDDGKGSAVRAQAEPERMARLHEIQREVVAMRPGRAAVVEFADWLGPRAQDPSLRADGMHFTTEEFLAVTQEWFGAEVERLWQKRWADFARLARADPGGAQAADESQAAGEAEPADGVATADPGGSAGSEESSDADSRPSNELGG